MPPVSYSIIKVPVSCNRDCGGGCALTAHVDISSNRLLKVTNSSFSPNHMTGCLVGLNAEKQLYADGRVLKPLIRNGIRGDGNFREASWGEALTLVAGKLSSTKCNYGTDSIMFLIGSGSCRSVFHNTILLPKRFSRVLGPCIETLSSYSSAASRFATPFVFGTLDSGIDIETLFESKLIILWGSNALDTRFSAKIESVLSKIKKDGKTPIIVIDPRRTRTVKAFSTQWIGIYPGTDSILMCAILHELIANKLVDSDFINKYSIGFDKLSSYIFGKIDGIAKTPQWAEKLCGIEAKTISDLAFLYGKTKPTAILPGLSIQRTLGGEDTYRLSMALQMATGNIGKIGGSSGGNFWGKLPMQYCPSLPIPSTENPLNIPVCRWPDAILKNDPLENFPDIKFLYNPGSNFLIQGADLNKNIKAFNKLDFIVTHEHFMTPTARFSDVILPATMWMERDDVIPGIDNCLLYSQKAVNPPTSVKDDYDIFCLLAEKLGFLDEFSKGKTSDEWIKSLLDNSEVRDIEEFKRTGILTSKNTLRTAFSDFIENPAENSLKTPSGLIEISSDNYSAQTEHSPFPKAVTLKTDANYPLRLITPHYRKRINSTNSNVPFFDGNAEDYLWINPEDADARKIEDCDRVTLFNDIGSIQTKVFVTDDIMQGVISLNNGIWPKFNGSQITSNNSVNFLTSTEPTLPSHGSRTHSVFAEVSRIHEGE